MKKIFALLFSTVFSAATFAAACPASLSYVELNPSTGAWKNAGQDKPQVSQPVTVIPQSASQPDLPVLSGLVKAQSPIDVSSWSNKAGKETFGAYFLQYKGLNDWQTNTETLPKLGKGLEYEVAFSLKSSNDSKVVYLQRCTTKDCDYMLGELWTKTKEANWQLCKKWTQIGD